MLPLFTYASHDDHPGTVKHALTVSTELVRTLEQLSNQADRVARVAVTNKNYQRAQRFEIVKNDARRVALELRREVIQPLRIGVALFNVKRNFEYVKRTVAELNRAIRVIRVIPPDVQRTISRSQQLFFELDRVL